MLKGVSRAAAKQDKGQTGECLHQVRSHPREKAGGFIAGYGVGSMEHVAVFADHSFWKELFLEGWPGCEPNVVGRGG